MKQLLLGFFIAAAAGVSAQITITNADMPSVNDTFRITTAIDTNGIDPSLTGANYTWSYLDFVAASQRIDTFFSVTSTPIAYQFFFNNGILYPNHQANYALRGPDIGIPQVPITNVFNYKKNSSAGYDNVGFGANISSVPSSVRNIPVDREYEFPMNHLNTHSSFSSYLITVPGFGAYGQDLTRNDTVDGWGSLTTPFGTFNCLRVKSTLDKIDTTYIDAFSFGTKVPRPEEVEYKWLAAGMGIPVLKIVTTSGVISLIEYQDFKRPVLSVEEYDEQAGFRMYPNPTNGELNMTFDVQVNDAVYVSLSDLNGKQLLSKTVQLNSGLLRLNLAELGLSTGVYLVEIRSNDEYFGTKKLVVQ